MMNTMNGRSGQNDAKQSDKSCALFCPREAYASKLNFALRCCRSVEMPWMRGCLIRHRCRGYAEHADGMPTSVRPQNT